MACSTLRRSQSNFTTTKVNFCSEVREFVEDSRQCQTLYANTDGSYKRTVNRNDLTALENFIYLTISNTKDGDPLTSEERKAFDLETQKLLKKICYTAKKFEPDEIHFTVVWMYYLDYTDCKVKSTPIFKILNKNVSSAFYIDTNLVEYNSWDSLIDYAELPQSFICVPRKGEYRFENCDGEDLLDLEFVCRNEGFVKCRLKNSRPFSQTAVKPWLSSTLHHIKRLREPCCKILEILCKLLPLGQLLGFGDSCIFNVALFLMSLGLKLLKEKKGKEKRSESEIMSDASDYSLMLMNDCRRENFSHLEPKNPQTADNSASLDKYEGQTLAVRIVEMLKKGGKFLLEILSFFRETIPFPTIVRRILLAAGVSSGNVEVWVQIATILPFFLDFCTPQGSFDNIEATDFERGFSRLQRNSSAKWVSELQSSGGRMRELLSTPAKPLSPFFVSCGSYNYEVSILKDATIPGCENFILNRLSSEFKLRRGALIHEIILKEEVIGGVVFLTDSLAVIAFRNKGYKKLVN